jgi:tetratricopeptide (TPR) repeat protein
MAGRLLDDDPEAAWGHASAARDSASRIGVVREATGLAAYRTGRYAQALGELRTARRVTGSDEHLPVMADCERGLGRPERALALAASPEVRDLDRMGQIEMLLVEAGARTDLGQLDAAVVTLQVQALRTTTPALWLARLRSAYSDALAAVGRLKEAREWLELAAAVDETGESGAADRLAEEDGLVLVDLIEEYGEDDGPDQDPEPEPHGEPEQDGEAAAGPAEQDRPLEKPED